MEIILCLKNSNWDCLSNWFISNILWIVVWSIVLFIFLTLPRIIQISRKLLNKNRFARGFGYGKRLADAFVMLWLSDMDYNHFMSECFIIGTTSGKNEIKIGTIVENELQSIKLAEVFELKNTKKVRAIKNFRNRMIFFIVRFYLVHFIGDDLKSYKKSNE